MLRLRELRKARHLNQEQLAQRLGITQATLSCWENEKYEIDNASLLKCADYFNVTVDYLLGREKKPSAPSDSLFDKITEIFNRLDDDRQQTALEYLEFLASRGNPKK